MNGKQKMNTVFKTKKIVALFIACLTLSSVFFGCKNNGDDNGDTEPASPLLTIVSEGASDYVIVRSANADLTEKNAVMGLRTAVKDSCGVTLDIVDDTDEVSEKAIYVGNIEREDVKELCADLGYNDYVISVIDTNVVICGGGSEMTEAAVERFIAEYISEEKATLEIPAELLIKEINTENTVSVKVGETELKKYSVILANDELAGIKNDATLLHRYCVDNFGFGLTVTNSMSSEKTNEIVVGKETSRKMSAELEAKLAECKENEGLIYFENGKIWLTGKSDAAVREAILVFKEEYLAADKASNGEITLSTENKKCEFDDKEYTVMSFNLLYEEIPNWCGTPEERTEAVIAHIRTAAPDLLGAQECTEYWYGALCEALGEDYGVVGEVDDSNHKWRNPIFYKKDKFELIETKTLWLTKTPEIQSKYTGSGLYRILTLAVLKDKETGKTFAHANTHLGLYAQEKPHHWKYLIQILDTVKYPLVLTGDFNAVRTEVYHTQILEAGYWNSIDMTSDCVTDSSLDFVFVTPESVHVIKHYSMPRMVNIGGVDMRPSDHPAVVTNFCLR